ncbi:hypothetical protein [Neobacillus massiliamazoniensis]|uniref:hypothetical protein n=1 Tax=Neobacillus massiliamazoniensis TaxID=1499688 RepID=UPI000AB08921|nr:hypothetical protein [Neobacillus massiliamazoniensis]
MNEKMSDGRYCRRKKGLRERKDVGWVYVNEKVPDGGYHRGKSVLREQIGAGKRNLST